MVMKTVDKKREFRDYYYTCIQCYSKLHLVTRLHVDEKPYCVCHWGLSMLPITEEMFNEDE